ncbi:tetratricopeptide repeat protein [Vibrio sp. S9_S30]|uniref:heme biosynthesis HemY N-terminal domain-containing protein n=1 Tax=Vibrio sp. S9_S30 TaxID=2720226 RepID=UPI001680AAC7|nr:heme biosynthesis HemY N-terminal domain-containing protein [Vibrio sp. S9_S30]MBD1559328.1 tetratricopeptide repeat protein [Vibrio sp. S9_S30]
MIRAIFLFVILGVGLYAGTQFSGQQGYVLISIADKTIEMSVTTLVIFIIIILAALFGLEFLIKKLLYTSSATWNWFSVRKMKRARRYTNEGIIMLLEGDWKGAEKKVTRWANHHDMPMLCYLVASEAAQGLGDKSKRDHYLTLASKQENSDLAVELTRAKQLVKDAQYELALDTLHSLRDRYTCNPIVLELLKTVYKELSLWQNTIELLPLLKKAKLIDPVEHDSLMLKAQCGLLADVAQQKGSEGLLAYWNGLPKKARQDDTLIYCLLEQLIERKADSQAYIIVRDRLKKQPDDKLYSLISEMNLPDLHPAVVLLQGALQKEGDSATIHSTLAQLLMRQENWSEAQYHFEQALRLRQDISDYAYLADVLEKQQLTQAAGDVSRKALALMESKS